MKWQFIYVGPSLALCDQFVTAGVAKEEEEGADLEHSEEMEVEDDAFTLTRR